MSAAPHEFGAPAPALAVAPDPAPAAAPSLAQLLSRRSAEPQGHAQGRRQIVPQLAPRVAPGVAPQLAPRVAPGVAPGVAPQSSRQPRASHATQAAPVRALREPTFDELVTGYGRHRGPQQPEAPTSLLRRLALRARLLPTPARRPPARATWNP